MINGADGAASPLACIAAAPGAGVKAGAKAAREFSDVDSPMASRTARDQAPLNAARG